MGFGYDSCNKSEVNMTSSWWVNGLDM